MVAVKTGDVTGEDTFIDCVLVAILGKGLKLKLHEGEDVEF